MNLEKFHTAEGNSAGRTTIVAKEKNDEQVKEKVFLAVTATGREEVVQVNMLSA
jgi:hypothetical protein